MRACLSKAVDEEGTSLTENVGCDQGRGTSLSGIWILTPCSFTIIPRAFDSFNLEKTALEKYSKERRRWSGPRNGRDPAVEASRPHGLRPLSADLPAAHRTRACTRRPARAPPPTVHRHVRLLCWAGRPRRGRGGQRSGEAAMTLGKPFLPVPPPARRQTRYGPPRGGFKKFDTCT